MNIDVVIPYAGTCPHRARALTCVLGHWPWPVTIARGTQPWCKAAAAMPAVARSSSDIVIVADADVILDRGAVEGAVRAVHSGVGWAVPHRTVHRLTPDATRAVLAGAPATGQPLAEREYHGVLGGGALVARRETLLDTPLDPRFIGWGQEDECWAFALQTLHGDPWRGDAPLFHLWHPPQERMTRRRGNPVGWQLRMRYVRARRDPEAMRALIEEARDVANATHQPAVHASAA